MSNLPHQDRMRLEPLDWRWARAEGPWQRPEPRKFDRLRSLERLAREDALSKVGITPYLTPQEASFWLGVCYTNATRKEFRETLLYLEDHDTDTALTAATVGTFLLDAMRVAEPGLSPSMVAMALCQLEPREVLGLFVDIANKALAESLPSLDAILERFLWAVWAHILPYLSEEEIAPLGEGFAECLTTSLPTPVAPFFLRMAGLLGMADTLREAIPKAEEQGWQPPAEAFLGLTAPEEVATFLRARPRTILQTGEQVRGLLAITGMEMLDYLEEVVLAADTKALCERLLRPLCRIDAPDAAPAMMRLGLACKAPELARQWLDERPGEVIEGLLPHARAGEEWSEALVERLVALRQSGHEEAMRAAAEQAPRAAQGFLRSRVFWDDYEASGPLPFWLAWAMDRTAPLEDWAPLPQLSQMGNLPLAEAHTRIFLQAFQAADDPQRLAQAAQENLTPDSLHFAAQEVLEAWSSQGQPPPPWLGRFAAELGGPEQARWLAVFATEAAKEGNWAMVEWACRTLAEWNGPAGEGALVELARSSTDPLLRERAHPHAHNVLSRRLGAHEDIADILMPDADDDAVALLAGRWEREFMVQGRRCGADHFLEVIASRPPLRALAQGLVWLQRLPTGEAFGLFTLNKTGKLRAPNRAFSLRPDATVEAAHPLWLEPASLSVWREFIPVETQPFPQLNRWHLRSEDLKDGLEPWLASLGPGKADALAQEGWAHNEETGLWEWPLTTHGVVAHLRVGADGKPQEVSWEGTNANVLSIRYLHPMAASETLRSLSRIFVSDVQR